jgi:PAS domain S-box-containing protein
MNSPNSGDKQTDKPRSRKGEDLRRQAEQKMQGMTEVDPFEFGPEEIRRQFHELQVHQIELSMQNEELKRIQGDLELSRDRYIDLYDFAPVGYVTVSEKGLILESNLAAATQLGVGRQQLVKQPLNRFIQNEDQDVYYSHLRQLNNTGTPQVFELRLRQPGGKPFWARLQAVACTDPGDFAVTYRLVISDITERKQLEQALQETSLYLQRLLDCAGAPIIVWDAQSRVSTFNSAFERLTGMTAAEVTGKQVGLIFPPGAAAASDDLRQPTASEPWNNLEIPVKHRDGSTRLLLWNSATLCAPDGKKPVATIAQGVDITERKLAEEAVRLALMVEQQDQFIAMFSHDLKSPLLGCITMLDLLLNGKMGLLSGEQVSCLSLIAESVRGRVALLQNLVDSYRIEAGASVVHSGNTDTLQIVESCCRAISLAAKSRGISINTNLAPDIAPIEADPTAISRIVQNLLDNALKFSLPDTQIGVSLKSSNGNIAIEVRDSGPGVPAEDELKLFQRFWQGGEGKKYAVGTGLGLYLTRQLVEAHGGKISYRNADGGGAVFTVVLPARQTRPAMPEHTPVGSPLNIMLVEDFEITRVGLRLMLEQVSGITLAGEAADGITACTMASALNPAVILMDIGLPDITGIEACRRIKASCPDTEVIMFTSHEDTDDIFAALAAGASGYCLKDTSLSNLVKAIRTVADGDMWFDPRISDLIQPGSIV